MIDASDRRQARFPAAKSEKVRTRIAQQLDDWKIGVGDLAICGGASGTDILFAEAALERGANLRLFLAQKQEEFVRTSVQPAGGEWVERFHALRKNAETATLPEKVKQRPNDLSIYARTNLWIIDTARLEVRRDGTICALLVWDEKPTGDGPGGTSDFATRVRDLGALIAIINPTKIS